MPINHFLYLVIFVIFILDVTFKAPSIYELLLPIIFNIKVKLLVNFEKSF